MDRTEYKASRMISNHLATLIRQGVATADQILEYETRDKDERAHRALQPRRPWFFGMTCDQIGLMP